jgi:hypothetical protein
MLYLDRLPGNTSAGKAVSTSMHERIAQERQRKNDGPSPP